MGCHFSKKRALPPPSPLTPLPQEKKNDMVKKKTSTTMEDLLALHPIEKKQVFLITNNKKAKTQSEAVCEENEKNKNCCSKEEIDTILIQCGRLSRSSSGKLSNESSVHLIKQSYGFDEEMEKPVSKPSPRRTPGRERSKSSKEGGRRLSRSPGRRSDNVTAGVSGCHIENSKQPVRMISVPPREKKAAINVNVISGKRCASPRSQSPGNTSRASFDYRRYPMAEIDGNAWRGEEFPTPRNKALMRKTCSHSQRSSEGISEARKAEMRINNVLADRVKDHLMSCRAKEKQLLELEILDETAKSFAEARTSVGRLSSSRRSSRDLDQSYAALLLEDIHNYHQQKVAHSVSTFSDKKSYKAEQATNDKEPKRLSEVAAEDGYVSLRSFGGELERQGSPIDVGLRGRKQLSSEKKHRSGNSQPYASRKRELNRNQPRICRMAANSSATAASS